MRKLLLTALFCATLVTVGCVSPQAYDQKTVDGLEAFKVDHKASWDDVIETIKTSEETGEPVPAGTADSFQLEADARDTELDSLITREKAKFKAEEDEEDE